MLANDNARDEADVLPDAAIHDKTAAVAWACPEIPQLGGSRNITNTYGLSDDVELCHSGRGSEHLDPIGQPSTQRSSTSSLTRNLPPEN